MNAPLHNKIIARNKKVLHDFCIVETYEAGVELKGTEVKSLKNQGGTINDSFARIISDEVILFNMHISPYKQGNIYNTDPIRQRKLLLHKREINKIATYLTQKGFALLPLSVYLKKGLIKIEIGIGKGKKLFDKRETLKEKDQKREMGRVVKSRIVKE